MASGAALLLHPQNNIYCFLFFTEFTNTQSQSEDYEEVRHLLGMRWFLSFFSLRSKILWFLNLLFLLGPTFWNKASPTSGHRHPKEIFLTHTHTHKYRFSNKHCSKNSKLSFKLNFLSTYLKSQQFVLCSLMYLCCLFSFLLLFGVEGCESYKYNCHTGFLHKTPTLGDTVYALFKLSSVPGLECNNSL